MARASQSRHSENALNAGVYICYCASNVFKSWIASAWYRDRKIDRWIVDWCLLESGKFHFPSGLARLSQASNQSILHRMQCSTMLNLGFKTRLGLKHSKTLAVACRQSGLIKWLAWATGLPQQPETTCAYPVAVLIRLLISTMFFFIFHHFPSFFIIFHHFPSFSIVFHHVPSFFIIFHHFPSFSTEQFGWSHFSNGWLETTVLHSRRNLNGSSLPRPWKVWRRSSRKQAVPSRRSHFFRRKASVNGKKTHEKHIYKIL